MSVLTTTVIERDHAITRPGDDSNGMGSETGRMPYSHTADRVLAAAEDSEPELTSTLQFRRTLGHFASGVAVVTGVVDDLPIGMSVSSFCSLSLSPAQVLFCPSRSSATWERIAETGRFCANVLSADQRNLGRQFAGSGDRFADVAWRAAPSGAPILTGALAWIDCTVSSVVDGGDHFIVVGDVAALGHSGSQAPLIWYRGQYLDTSGLSGALGATGKDFA